MKINEMVNNNNLNFLRDRQKAFQKVKNEQTRAKSLFNTFSAMNVQNLKGNYEQRVFKKKEDARRTEEHTKKLEVEE